MVSYVAAGDNPSVMAVSQVMVDAAWLVASATKTRLQEMEVRSPAVA
jgi:hypothetical protein